MPFYLVFMPESDYEMFEGNTPSGNVKMFNRKVREANSADEAILDFWKWNEGGDTSPVNLTKYIAIEVRKKECAELLSKCVLDAEIMYYNNKINENSKNVELAELERLKRKYPNG